MRRELERGVESPVARRGKTRDLHEDEIGIGEPFALRLLAKSGDARARVGKQVRPVHDEERPAVDADVARIAKQRREVRDQARVALRRIRAAR